MATTVPIPATTAKVYNFTYRVRTPDGKVVAGKASATDRQTVVKELAARGLVDGSVPLSISGGPSSSTGEISLGKRFKHREMVTLTRMLATMSEAGLDRLKTLDVAVEETANPALRDALIEVRAGVRSGKALSEAMATQPGVFTPDIVRYIVAGETSNSVTDALGRVADTFESADKIRGRIRKAMINPAFLIGAVAAVVAFMIMWLVPKFADMYMEIGGEDATLPLLTRAVVGLGDILKFAIPALLVAAVPTITTWRRKWRHDDKIRAKVDPIKMKIPVFGNIVRLSALARLTRTATSLIGSGVDRIEALETTARTSGNYVYEQAFLRAAAAQRAGQKLADPLRADPDIPTFLVTMVATGEETGTMDEMFARAADTYERDLEKAVDTLTESLGPLATIVIIPIVGVVMAAMYAPYLGMLNLG